MGTEERKTGVPSYLWIGGALLAAGLLCACVVGVLTATAGLGVGALAVFESRQEISPPVEVQEATTAPAALTPTGPTHTEAPATPTTGAADATQRVAEFAGDWVGEWHNETFGSSGAVTARVNVSPDGTIRLDVDFDGLVFGLLDPPAKTFIGSYDETGTRFDASADPLFGDLMVVIDDAGRISIAGERVPVESVVAFEANGTATVEQISVDYVISMPAGGQATGRIELARAEGGGGPDPLASFIKDFERALQHGDVEFLLARLHPAVTDRYGEDACRRYLEGVADPSFQYTILDVHEPSSWEYALDGQSTTIPETIAVEAQLTTSAGTQQTTAHYAEVEGELRWFTDCGDPLAP